MLFTLIEAGSIGFWLLLAICAIVISSLADEDRPGAASCVAAGTVVFLALFGNLHPVAIWHAHPLLVLLAVPGYLASGVLWCVAKWTFFVVGRRDRVRAVEAGFASEIARRRELLGTQISDEEKRSMSVGYRHEADSSVQAADPRVSDGREVAEVSPELRRLRQRLAALDTDDGRKDVWDDVVRKAGVADVAAPKVRQNKSRIITWMTWWPASMAWTVVNDPLRRAFRFLYERISGFLQAIADRAFRDVDNVWKTGTP